MGPVLVTGATGFIGWHVARSLLEHGRKVRALVRTSNSALADRSSAGNVRDLDVEPAPGDLRDPDSLARAVAGCSQVFHVAADYRLWAKHSEELYASNVEGTRNMLAAARTARVESFVYTSTVGCIGVPAGGIGDETQSVAIEQMTGAYKRSKFLAEKVALDSAASGFPVTIVNPTAPVGDHDFKPTPTGKIILDFLRGDMPAYIDTGLNLVDVRDVAEGHLMAGERGRAGERYILGCENITLAQILERLAPIAQRPAPRTRIPYAVAYGFAVLSSGWARVTGKPPRAPIDGVRMAKKRMWVTHDKATRELGYRPGSVDGALERAVKWFRDNGYC